MIITWKLPGVRYALLPSNGFVWYSLGSAGITSIPDQMASNYMYMYLIQGAVDDG